MFEIVGALPEPSCPSVIGAVAAPVQPPVRRLHALDGLRGLLALFVALHHICSYLWLGGLSYIGSQLAVLAFFALSGCVLTRGWAGNFPAFLLRRFVRLWPVYALGTLAGALLLGHWPSLSQLFWLPVLGPLSGELENPPSWSLFIESWMMLAMPVVVWCARGSPVRAAVGVLAFALGARWLNWHLIYGPVFILGALSSRVDWHSRVLEMRMPQFLGRISYSFYLTHWLVLEVFVWRFGNHALVFALPAMLVLAWCVWWGVERPSVLASRKIGFSIERDQKPCSTQTR